MSRLSLNVHIGSELCEWYVGKTNSKSTKATAQKRLWRGDREGPGSLSATVVNELALHVAPCHKASSTTYFVRTHG